MKCTCPAFEFQADGRHAEMCEVSRAITTITIGPEVLKNPGLVETKTKPPPTKWAVDLRNGDRLIVEADSFVVVSGALMFHNFNEHWRGVEPVRALARDEWKQVRKAEK